MRTISGPPLRPYSLVASASWPVAVGRRSRRSRRGLPAPRPSSLENEGTTYDVVGVITDADGTTHTRLERRYDGLPVIGGDRVVHRGRAGAAAGVSQTLDAPLSLATTPASRDHRLGRALAEGDLRSRGMTDASRSRLVVDATSGTGRLAWEVVTGGTQKDGTPSRLATYVDARSRQGAVARAADRRPSTAPASPSTPAPSRSS